MMQRLIFSIQEMRTPHQSKARMTYQMGLYWAREISLKEEIKCDHGEIKNNRDLDQEPKGFETRGPPQTYIKLM